MRPRHVCVGDAVVPSPAVTPVGDDGRQTAAGVQLKPGFASAAVHRDRLWVPPPSSRRRLCSLPWR